MTTVHELLGPLCVLGLSPEQRNARARDLVYGSDAPVHELDTDLEKWLLDLAVAKIRADASAEERVRRLLAQGVSGTDLYDNDLSLGEGWV